MKRLLLFLVLISVSFSSLLWQIITDAAISTKPVIYQGMVVVASDDGSIYAVDATTGTKKWRTFVGKDPNEVLVFDNSIVASTTGGSVVKLDRDGKIVWKTSLLEQNASYLYGADANQKWIAVSANNGIYLIGKDGSISAKPMSYSDSITTAPAAGPDSVVFGKGGELINLKEQGTVVWKTQLSEASFGPSRPLVDGGVVYVGALDGAMHAYALNTGGELWKAKTRNWVMGTALAKEGMVYFGSNDGRVHAVDASNGEFLWDAQTQLAVQTQPTDGTMGGRPVVFVGGSDRSIYAIERETGEIVWKGSAAGAVASPLFYNNMVIFGAQDKAVYSYSTERACSITNPTEGGVYGNKELVVRGKYASEAGGAQVFTNVNDAGWEEANVSEDGWVQYINPKEKLNPGINTIACKVADGMGEESGERFTSVSITYDPGIALSTLVVAKPSGLVENVPFAIHVNDGDDGTPVERFEVLIDGKTYFGDRNATITLPAGSYQTTIRKIGFRDAIFTLDVSSKGPSPLVLVVSAILILVIIYVVWTRFLAQRFAKPK